MKRLAFCLLFLISTFSSLCAHQKGWYLGVGLGAGLMSSKRTSMTTENNPRGGPVESIFADQATTNEKSSYLQGMLGYKFLTGRWFFSCEGFVGWSEFTNVIEGRGQTAGGRPDNKIIQSTLKRTANAGFVTMLGYCLGFTAPYVKMGFEVGQYEHRWSEVVGKDLLVSQYKNSQIVPGFLVGGGFEIGAGLATIRLDATATLTNTFEAMFKPNADYKIYNRSRPLAYVAKLDIIYHLARNKTLSIFY